MLNEANGDVFSQLEINTYDPANKIKTNLWLRSGHRLPIAIMRFAAETISSTEERFFAVFVIAEIIHQPPTESIVSIGGLGGMSELLWSNKIHSQQENYIWTALPTNPLATPEGGLQLWIGQRVYVKAELRKETLSESHMILGFQIFPEGLNAKAQLITDGEHNLIAFGLSDRLEAVPGLYFSGGVLLGVFELDNFTKDKMRWWGEAEFAADPVQLMLRYNSNGEIDTLESEIGYEIQKNTIIFGRLSISEERGYKISFGTRFEF